MCLDVQKSYWGNTYEIQKGGSERTLREQAERSTPLTPGKAGKGRISDSGKHLESFSQTNRKARGQNHLL